MQTLLLCAFVGLTCASWLIVICASQFAKAAELVDQTNNESEQ